jgi:hypothetical protein
MKNNLPALDDDNLRALNSKKIMSMVDEIAENMRESKKAAKVTKYYLVIMIGILILLVGGSAIIIAIKSGGISNFFDNYFLTDNLNKRIVCSYSDQELTFRSTPEAKAFTEIFNTSNCSIIDKRSK